MSDDRSTRSRSGKPVPRKSIPLPVPVDVGTANRVILYGWVRVYAPRSHDIKVRVGALVRESFDRRTRKRSASVSLRTLNPDAWT